MFTENLITRQRGVLRAAVKRLFWARSVSCLIGELSNAWYIYKKIKKNGLGFDASESAKLATLLLHCLITQHFRGVTQSGSSETNLLTICQH